MITQHDHRPPKFKVAGVRPRNCPSSSNSRFTAIRSARNVFVAGCSLCLPPMLRAPATTVARCSVDRIGRARTIALAILRESCSSPIVIEHDRPAHVLASHSQCRPRCLAVLRSIRMSSGPAARNEKPRSGRSSCMLETPRSASTPSTGGKLQFPRDLIDLFRNWRVPASRAFPKLLQPFARDFQSLRVAVQPNQPSRRQPPGNFYWRVRPAPTSRRCKSPSGRTSQPAENFFG